jgi:2-haloacid dehalogenase
VRRKRVRCPLVPTANRILSSHPISPRFKTLVCVAGVFRGDESCTSVTMRHSNHVWHRLKPSPDAVRGLERMKKNYVLATLSNGNVSLLVEMAKNAGLPWDAVLSAELFHHFKPDREVYLGTADLLGYKPAEMMMVAAHPGDLQAAQACGLRTGFVARPLENGPGKEPAVVAGFPADVSARDFLELAEKLG